MAEDRFFPCPLLERNIPEGLCVEILIAPGMTPEVAQFAREQIEAVCEDCPYSAD